MNKNGTCYFLNEHSANIGYNYVVTNRQPVIYMILLRNDNNQLEDMIKACRRLYVVIIWQIKRHIRIYVHDNNIIKNSIPTFTDTCRVIKNVFS